MLPELHWSSDYTSTRLGMEALAKHVEELAATADVAARRNLLVTLRDLAYSIEDPQDTLNRIGYLVRIVLDSMKFHLSSITEPNYNLNFALASPNGSCSYWL